MRDHDAAGFCDLIGRRVLTAALMPTPHKRVKMQQKGYFVEGVSSMSASYVYKISVVCSGLWDFWPYCVENVTYSNVFNTMCIVYEESE